MSSYMTEISILREAEADLVEIRRNLNRAVEIMDAGTTTLFDYSPTKSAIIDDISRIDAELEAIKIEIRELSFKDSLHNVLNNFPDQSIEKYDLESIKNGDL